MSEEPVTKDRWPDRVRQSGAVVAPVALLALLAWLFWPSGELPQSRERVVTTIDMVQPPPPEPEDEIMEEEEEIVEPEEAPPSEAPNEQPSETPQDSPAEPASNQLAGLDRPADAGSDNFRLAAGGGGGLFGRGTGGGGGEWGSYLAGHIRRALMRDPRTRAARGSVRVTVVISEARRFTQAALRGTTGDPDLDTAIREVLRDLPPISVPKPAGHAAVPYLTIDMRRN